MKYTHFKEKNRDISRISFKIGQTIPDTSLLSYIYEQGINTFDVSLDFMDSLLAFGEWVKKNSIKNITIMSHDDILNDPTDNINKYGEAINTSSLIYHLSNITEITEDLAKKINTLQLLKERKSILGLGIRTHVAIVAKELILKNIASIQLPLNAVEHGIFLPLKNLILERNILSSTINVFGDDDILLTKYPEELLISSFLSMTHNSILIMEFKVKEDADRIIGYLDSYKNEIFPIIEDFCNKCQKCEQVCMNAYPLARWVRYCRNIDDGLVGYKQKLQDENIHFDCINCNLCEQNCCLNVPIKEFIKQHLLFL